MLFLVASMLLNSQVGIHQGHGKLLPSETFEEGELKNRSGIEEDSPVPELSLRTPYIGVEPGRREGRVQELDYKEEGLR